MKFNSQIATSRSQSERLLSLDLKKETADMVHYNRAGAWRLSPIEEVWDMKAFSEYGIPAWSLHRLVEMLASKWGEVMLFLPDAYDDIISDIEIEIGRGNFNKEYLVDKNALAEKCKGVLEYLDYINGREE